MEVYLPENTEGSNVPVAANKYFFPIPGSVQSQVGWGIGKPGLVEDLPCP